MFGSHWSNKRKLETSSNTPKEHKRPEGDLESSRLVPDEYVRNLISKGRAIIGSTNVQFDYDGFSSPECIESASVAAEKLGVYAAEGQRQYTPYTAFGRSGSVSTSWTLVLGEDQGVTQSIETPGRNPRRTPVAGRNSKRGTTAKDSGGGELSVGAVIQLSSLLSPPIAASSATRVRTETLLNTQGAIRTHRFVVISQSTPGGLPGYCALPIKTYNGEGVAGQGIVKSHHAIVHTSRQPPQPTQAELPRRVVGGTTEAGMLTYPIRVRPRYEGVEGYALDPMARLDFASVHQFDNDVSVDLFGRVHESSDQALILQFRYVWQYSAPTISQLHTRISVVNLDPERRGSSGARAPLNLTPSSQVPAARSTSSERTTQDIGFAGPIAVDEITRAVEHLQLRAVREHLPPPPLPNAEWQRYFARYYAPRRQYFEAIYTGLSGMRQAVARSAGAEARLTDNRNRGRGLGQSADNSDMISISPELDARLQMIQKASRRFLSCQKPERLFSVSTSLLRPSHCASWTTE